MAYFIFGLVAGIGLGAWATQRWHQLKADRALVAPDAPVRSTIRPPGEASDDPPPITKKAAKLGITPDDLRPSDDILTRMQRAWDMGISLEELDELEASGDAPPPSDEPRPATPPPRPLPARVVAAEQGSPSTVTEAVERLAAEGYGDDLRLDGGEVSCSSCGTSHPNDLVEVDRVFRFEGPSDPADEAIVLGLRCPACGTRGSLVSAFGPDADPELAQAFTYLATRAGHG